MEGDGGDFGGGGVLFPCSHRRIVAARQYPVFGQPRRSPPRRGAPEPETIATQSPAPLCRKSGSTGSVVLRWRQRLVGLGRSHSDGKDRFVFFDAGGGGNGGRRRSFLPYKQDLVGLFASATAFRRTYHPF